MAPLLYARVAVGLTAAERALFISGLA